jgi:hypothetical protein
MEAGRELFRQHVRPLLTDRCARCHGGGKKRGGLDMTSRAALLKGGDGGPVVVPGKARESRLYRAAAHLDEPHMPPKGEKGGPLTRNQLALLARWIDLGASYDRPLLDRADPTRKGMVVSAADRDFWSFRPLKRPTVPAVKDTRARNPIDRFLIARQEPQGLRFAPQAERRTLIRRLAFDLAGLPPAPAEVDAFLADRAPGAYERLVDRLLASPAHGERWGRHWLDVARFAESHGFEHDYDRPTAYPYRDFVIQALNLDLPYDTFVRWQLAGDEFAPDNRLALTATGFLGAGVHSTQITANTAEKERYDELDDMLRTTGTAMLGLTIGCARCHDHKFDPIPTRDYYRLLSTFTTTVRTEVDLDLDPAQARAARARHQVEERRLAGELALYQGDVVGAQLDRWLARGAKVDSVWTILDPLTVKSAGKARFARLPDGSHLASGPNATFDTYTLSAHTELQGITALRLEALAHPSMVRGGPGRAGNGNFALSDVQLRAAPKGQPGKAQAVALVKARATFEQRGLPVAAAIDNDKRSAWAIDPQFGKDHAAVFDLAKPLGFTGGTTLTVRLSFNNNTGHNIGRLRLSLSTSPTPAALAGDGVPAAVRAILARPGKPDAPAREVLLAWFASRDPGWRQHWAKLEAHRAAGARVAKVKALICSEGLKPLRLHTQGADFLEHTHFLKRGDPHQKGEVAPPGFLQVLTRTPDAQKRWQATPPAGWRTSYRRRALANWITDVEGGAGHLLARVIVNRLWHHHFGRGLVSTPSDFGMQGDRPSHPELLDWLACEVIANGWHLKPIHRLIVTSAAYRQGQRIDPNASKIDPDNRLLWRRAPRRLEAEVIRDAMLAASGELDRRMFGPGTLDVRRKRRSIYFFVKRSARVPMMVLFDAPDADGGAEQRVNTTVAPQALHLMNNAVIRELASAFARRLGTGSAADRVRRGYAVALGQAPAHRELADAVDFLAEQAAGYRAAGKANADQFALADFCQVLLGLNEFLYID